MVSVPLSASSSDDGASCGLRRTGGSAVLLRDSNSSMAPDGWGEKRGWERRRQTGGGRKRFAGTRGMTERASTTMYDTSVQGAGGEWLLLDRRVRLSTPVAFGRVENR